MLELFDPMMNCITDYDDIPYNAIHYSDAILSTIASQIIGVSIVCSTVCSGADKKNQSSVSLAFVRGIHW